MRPSDTKPSYLLRCALSALMVALCGCATPPPLKMYRGSDLNASEIATIYRQSFYEKGWGVAVWVIVPFPRERNHWTIVREIDGRAIKFPVSLATKSILLGENVEVSAGQHSVQLDYRRERILEVCNYLCSGEFSKQGLAINFFAEGQHEYRVFAYIPDEREWVWVEDMTTGTVVAGEKPPDLD